MAKRNVGTEGFTGLYIPMVTPMTDNGELDHDGIIGLARHLANAKGVEGIVTGARIGEGPVLDLEEHVALVQSVRTALPESPIIASILPVSAEQGIRHTAAMKDAGADAVMVFPPLLLAWGVVPESVKLAFYEDLSAGSSLPIVAFQLPVRSYWMQPDTIASIAALPGVVSMKEASFDMQLYGATLEAIRKSGASMTVLNGNDHFVAEGALMGSEGALIGIANLVPSAWAEILRLSKDGRPKEALELQRRLRKLQDLVFSEPILDAVGRIKAILQDEGVIASSFVRRPQLGVGDAELASLIRGYKEILSDLKTTNLI